MKDFKKLPKMACGGGVKKYETGGKVTAADVSARLEKYQDSPNYNAKEDDSPAGVRAQNAYRKAHKEAGGNFDKPDFMKASPKEYEARETGAKAARNVIAKDREQVKTMSNVDAMGNALKRGGKVKRGNKK